MEIENKVSEDFWARHRPASTNNKSLFYRYENEGIVVYDSSARIYDEESSSASKLKKNFCNNKKKLEILDVEEYGIR